MIPSQERPTQPPPPKRDRGAWSNPLVRAAGIVLILATMIVLSVPFMVVRTGGRRVARLAGTPGIASARLRVARADIMRPHALAKDSSIAALPAGIALNSLMAGDSTRSDFPLRPVTPVRRPWLDEEITEDMFRSARPREDKTLPSSSEILLATKLKFSAEELDFLERVAHAPLWREVEAVGRAPTVDILGGRYVIPFPEGANAAAMPIPKFARVKAIAYAGVSRAAYYQSRNQRDSAEAALAAVNSLGLAMIDNSSNLIETLIGEVVVGIGRTALIQLHELNGNPAGGSLKARNDSVTAEMERDRSPRRRALPRASLIALARDSTLSPGFRYSALWDLAVVPCHGVRELVAGFDQDTRVAFADARRTLARFPSEVALVEMIERTADRTPYSEGATGRSLASALSSISAGVLRMPRLEGCTNIVAMSR